MVRNKIIRMNKENKILIFGEERVHRSEIFIPDLWIDKIYYGGFLKSLFVTNDLEEEYEFLCSLKRQEKRFHKENGHLKQYTIEQVRDYYFKREDLTREQIEKLMEFCYKQDLIPEFIELEELLQILKKEDTTIYYDANLVKVLKKLPSKIEGRYGGNERI